MERYKEIERSIIKKYRKEIWSKFIKAVKEYELIKENDKVMVCISGGKDSFLLAKCIQELERHGKVPFTAEYVVMNPGYDEIHEKNILENAKTLNVPIKEFKSDIFEVVDKISYDSPCYMCAKMRRGYLYSKAKELGCNKIALGHHFNDVIETTLLSMFYGSEVKTMMPKLHSDNFPGIELIRPLYMVEEASIISQIHIAQLNNECLTGVEIRKIASDIYYSRTGMVLSHQMVFFECLLSKSRRPFQFILTFCIRTEKVEQK
mgnify:CR=1 FL=1